MFKIDYLVMNGSIYNLGKILIEKASKFIFYQFQFFKFNLVLKPRYLH